MDVGTEITGTLGLKHGGQAEYKGDDCIDLQVVGGEVKASWEDDNGRQTTTIRPQDGGYVRFSTEAPHGPRGPPGMAGERGAASTRIICCSARRIQHDVHVESFYEAELVDSRQTMTPELMPLDTPPILVCPHCLTVYSGTAVPYCPTCQLRARLGCTMWSCCEAFREVQRGGP